jgi:hypothetical protein
MACACHRQAGTGRQTGLVACLELWYVSIKRFFRDIVLHLNILENSYFGNSLSKNSETL